MERGWYIPKKGKAPNHQTLWEVWLVPVINIPVCRKPAWLGRLHYIATSTVSWKWANENPSRNKSMWTYTDLTPAEPGLSISFVTFGLCIAMGGLINCMMKPYQRPPDSGCGAEVRSSSGQHGQDWSGVCNLSLTQAGDRLHSIHLKPGVHHHHSKKHRHICAMYSWTPKLWLLLAAPAQSLTSLPALQKTV